jgi:Pyruvate/2-oxoacid:ferredoxin oxidoreductase gamma subunit
VHLARDEVLSPAVPDPHALVVFNPQSMEKFAPMVRKGGVIVYDSTVISDVPDPDPGVRVIGIPASEIAYGLGQRRVKNVVALGALQAAADFLPRESLFAALEDAVHGDGALLELNRQAFDAGFEAARVMEDVRE